MPLSKTITQGVVSFYLGLVGIHGTRPQFLCQPCSYCTRLCGVCIFKTSYANEFENFEENTTLGHMFRPKKEGDSEVKQQRDLEFFKI